VKKFGLQSLARLSFSSFGIRALGFDSGIGVSEVGVRKPQLSGVPDFPGNRNLNRDTGFQPVLAIINLQSTQFASIIAPRTGRRPVSR
jgi:hypothetical protein